jgi:hypothetical protein
MRVIFLLDGLGKVNCHIKTVQTEAFKQICRAFAISPGANSTTSTPITIRLALLYASVFSQNRRYSCYKNVLEYLLRSTYVCKYIFTTLAL